MASKRNVHQSSNRINIAFHDFFSSVRSLDETLASSLGQRLLFQLGRQRGGLRPIRRHLVNTWPMPPHISHLWRWFTKRPWVFKLCENPLIKKVQKRPPRDWVPIFSLKTKSERIFNWNRAKAKFFISLNCSNLQHCVQGSLRRKERSNSAKTP